MTTTEFLGPGLSLFERDNLRASLSQRREELHAALDLYEETNISAAPRAALAQRTRDAIVDIDAALAILHKNAYGLCEDCHRPLSLPALKLRPLEMRCRDCERPVTA
jgi:RNA polymerase-binding transcription factor DksA